MSMLLFKLKIMEGLLKKSTPPSTEQLQTLLKLENLLLEVNFQVESIPDYSFSKLVRLLNDINGVPMLPQDIELLKTLMDDDFK